jgi:hypothetical protein
MKIEYDAGHDLLNRVLNGLDYLNRGELSDIEPLNLLNGSIFFVDRDLGCQSSMLRCVRVETGGDLR